MKTKARTLARRGALGTNASAGTIESPARLMQCTCWTGSDAQTTVGALIIRIGFWGTLL